MSAKTYRTFTPMFEELCGERVVVRPYCEGDAQSVYEAIGESRDHLRPWMPFADAHQTLEESRDWLIHVMAKWLLRKDFVVGIWDAASDRYLGSSGLHLRDWEIRHFEIGYWVRSSAEGHGYVTETVQLLTDYAFNTLQANRVQIRCDEKNARSAAVAQRLGFVQEALLRNHDAAPDGSLRNTLVFSLIPTDRI
jgi:RimJ/RimL family protein N-acetyltransferase